VSLFLLLPLLLGFGVESPLASLPGGFEADRIVRLEGGPEVHFFLRPGSEVVALRLSIPLRESPDEAGAAQILRAGAEARMETMARRIGARSRVQRTPEGLVYEVAGPSTELDFLLWILNEGVRAPDSERFAELRRRQLAEVLRRQETPQGVLAQRIREAAGGSGVPLLGSAVALERMTAALVGSVWARSHGQNRARLVVAGEVEPEVFLASLTDLRLPSTAPDPLSPPSAPLAQTRPRPEVIRHWVSEAWVLEGGRDPRALVAVALLGDRIAARTGSYELGAELWEVAGRWTLVLSGAAYPRDQQAMRSRLRGLLAEASASVSDTSVRNHAAQIRGDLLLASATPWGLADLVGQALDLGEEPAGIQQLLDSLARLGGSDLTAFFDALSRRTPLRDEVRP